MVLKINNTRKIGQSPLTPQTTVFSMARYSGRSSIVQMWPKGDCNIHISNLTLSSVRDIRSAEKYILNHEPHYKPGEEVWGSRLVSSSCSTSGTRRVTVKRLKHYLI